MVSAPVGHLTARVIPEEAEVVMDALCLLGVIRRRTQPEVIVQLRWHHRDIGDRLFLTPAHAGDSNSHGVNLANSPRPDQFAPASELVIGALLTAGLHNAFMISCRRDHRL